MGVGMQGIAGSGDKNGRGRKTWNECVKVHMKRLGLINNNAHNREKWRNLTNGNRPTLHQCGNDGVIIYGLRFRDVKRYW